MFTNEGKNVTDLTSSSSTAGATKIRFGLYEADLKSRELHRAGVPVRIQDQPFRVLSLLLAARGGLVTREELHELVWGPHTTSSDLDKSLKTAINKVREALNDSAENPKYIETLPKRGYRFLVPVETEVLAEPELTSFPQEITQSNEPAPENTAPAPLETGIQARRPRKIPFALVSAALSIIIVLIVMFWLRQQPTINIHHIVKITSSGRVHAGQDNLIPPVLLTDGKRVFYFELRDGESRLAQTSITGGPSSLLPLPAELKHPEICDLSRDGLKLLLRDISTDPEHQTLWVIPTQGGVAYRIPNLSAHDAAWMPDGDHILYAVGSDLYTASVGGSEERLYKKLPGPAYWLRWSPGSDRLTMTISDLQSHTDSLWALDPARGSLKQLFQNLGKRQNVCCGSWTSDGRNYVFQSSDLRTTNIYLAHSGFFGFSSPSPVTSGPLNYRAPAPSPIDHRLVFLGDDRHYLQRRFDPATHSFNISPGMDGMGRTEFSRSGKWVSWIRNSDGSLWRERSDGTELVQVTLPPTVAWMMQWSPDDERLVYMARSLGSPWKLFISDESSGTSTLVLNETYDQSDPDWSSDGKRLVFGRAPESTMDSAHPSDIRIVELLNHKVTVLPNSSGKFSPRWSPDGRYILALNRAANELTLYDTTKESWRTILQLGKIQNPTWASDSKSIFFEASREKFLPLYRISIVGGKIEKQFSLEDLEPMGVIDYSFLSLAPADMPLISTRTWVANLYTLDLDN